MKYSIRAILCVIFFISLSCNLKVIEDLVPNVPVTTSYTVDCYNVSFQFSSEISPTQINWDFGDGENSTEQSPQHRFKPGNYQVNLSITDGQLLGDTTFTVQVPFSKFIGRFGTVLDDAEGVGIIENEEGNFIALGTSFNTFYGLEVNPCGEELNYKALAMENNISPGEMIRLSNGNYALAGFHSEGGNGFIFLVDEKLELASVNNFMSPSNESTFYNNIIETSDNELVISGTKFGNGQWGLALHKTNLSAQTIIGPRLYTASEIGAGPILDSSAGGFIMIYRSSSSSISNITYSTLNESFESPQAVIIKSRPSTNDQFTGLDAELVEDNNILVFGTIRDISANVNTPFLYKIKNGGDEVFFEELSPDQFDNVIEFFFTPQFEILPDGYLFGGVNKDQTNFYLYKTDLAGNVIWDQVYSINNGSYVHDILVASDGGYVLIGGEEGAQEDEIIIIKTDNNGNS